jgi:hypothetical protein
VRFCLSNAVLFYPVCPMLWCVSNDPWSVLCGPFCPMTWSLSCASCPMLSCLSRAALSVLCPTSSWPVKSAVLVVESHVLSACSCVCNSEHQAGCWARTTEAARSWCRANYFLHTNYDCYFNEFRALYTTCKHLDGPIWKATSSDLPQSTRKYSCFKMLHFSFSYCYRFPCSY